MARKMNYDAAKRREWKAEARKEKAMEIAHEQYLKIETRERYLNSLATAGQLAYITAKGMHKYCGHDDSYLETMTIRAADAIIKKYRREVEGRKPKAWKDSPKKRPYQGRRKEKKPEYKPLKTVFETQGKPNMDGANIIRSKGPVQR